MRKTVVTASAAGTARAAAALARTMRGGEVVALVGPLGAGKTTFVQAFARALGVKERVQSPTFILVHEHRLPMADVRGQMSGIRRLVHADAYRGDVEQFVNVALHEYFGDPETVTLVEWADRLAPLLPKTAIRVRIRPLGGDRRRLEIVRR